MSFSRPLLAYYTVDAGAWIHEHSHPNDEVWNVIDGRLEITIAGESKSSGRDVRPSFPRTPRTR